jgi:hypothetical protein
MKRLAAHFEYPHWMMVAGAWLVVAGFIGLGFSRYMNRAPAEDNLHPEPPSNSSAYRNLEAAFWRSFCSSEQIRSSWPHGGTARITSVSASNAANSRPRDFGSSPDFLVQADYPTALRGAQHQPCGFQYCEGTSGVMLTICLQS